jgi:putative ATP-dependent endonuclease of OLD family
LNATALPNAKHLFNVINSQNNERVFFTDKVLLGEGLHDRIVFEKVLQIVSESRRIKDALALEIVSVEGKGLFAAYQKLLQACKVKWVLIADRDYIEQIATDDIKSLFVTNGSEIKKDVIDNIKSLDGDALFTRIEEAMRTGNWDDAREIWDYIKSRRRSLKRDLNVSEKDRLKAFVIDQEARGVFILERGTLEDYLPEGYRGKDTEKLISLVSSDGFWKKLPPDARDDLERIARIVLGIPSSKKKKGGSLRQPVAAPSLNSR